MRCFDRLGGVRTTKRERSRLPFAILGSIGLLFLALMLFVGGKQALFVLHASRATGTYVGAVAHSGGNHGGTFLYPRFEFTTSDGRTMKFTSRNGSTQESYSDGQKVPILYDPSAPTHAIIDSFWSLWGATLFVSVFVLGFLGLPYCIWRSM